MPRTNFQELLDAGVHFGHLKRKWNPKMAPYIFMEKNGIHIIDLHKTVIKIDEAANVMKQLARAGRKILFVATKKQAKEIVADKCKELGVPMEVAEVWAKGGEGAEKLAILAAKVAEQCVCKLKPLDEWSWDIEKKIETIAKEIYGAAAIDYTAQAKSDLKKIIFLRHLIFLPQEL